MDDIEYRDSFYSGTLTPYFENLGYDMSNLEIPDGYIIEWYCDQEGNVCQEAVNCKDVNLEGNACLSTNCFAYAGCTENGLDGRIEANGETIGYDTINNNVLTDRYCFKGSLTDYFCLRKIKNFECNSEQNEGESKYENQCALFRGERIDYCSRTPEECIEDRITGINSIFHDNKENDLLTDYYCSQNIAGEHYWCRQYIQDTECDGFYKGNCLIAYDNYLDCQEDENFGHVNYKYNGEYQDLFDEYDENKRLFLLWKYS